MLTPSLSRNAPAISSLTISIAAGGTPSALWSNIGEVVSTLAYCLSPHWFEFFGVLIFTLCGSKDRSSLSDLLWAGKCSPHVFGMLYYGAGVP
jgi:hypothetical protein